MSDRLQTSFFFTLIKDLQVSVYVTESFIKISFGVSRDEPLNLLTGELNTRKGRYFKSDLNDYRVKYTVATVNVGYQ